MRVMVTTSRMPFAVDEIRKLGEAGNEVTAVDTFAAAPGSHSRGATRHVEVPPPAQETAAFVDAVADAVERYQIEWVLPAFEEVFYLAAHRDRFPDGTELFFPDFETLRRVHDKVTFTDLCRQLDLPVAESVVATNPEELRAAVGRFDHWFARAAYGRGGLNILTNTGELAGEGSLDDAVPTPDDPWICQEFLEGVDRCSWSVVHHGEVVLHSTYEHPLTIDGRGGIVFESVDAPETLAAAQAVARELDWHGQISMDFLRTEDGVHHVVECNPRPTDGCTLATASEFELALFGEVPPEPVVVPAGRKTEIGEAVLRDVLEHLGRAARDLQAADNATDVYAAPGDHLPLLYTVFSLRHVHAYRRALGLHHRSHNDLVASQFFDVSWDGTPIA
ncbi:MAG: ATP-grasp domain-containing protein [Acidimicrobiia bacterium]|nr:ATP-grasp domain-containing protein [Acidimicrobiia bacterium]